MITKRGDRGRIVSGGATGGSIKGRTFSKRKKVQPVTDDFMPPPNGERVKGYEDGPELSRARRLLNREPAPPRTGPEFRASVKDISLPIPPRPTTFEPKMETPLDPEPRVTVEDTAPEPEYDDPNTAVKQDETLRDIIDAARRNRKGYTGDDPALKPITFRRAFGTTFAAHFGRVEPDGTVVPRNDPRFKLGEDTWGKWLVMGLAIFGEAMTPAEKVIYFEFTGRKKPPTKRLREIWVALEIRGDRGLRSLSP